MDKKYRDDAIIKEVDRLKKLQDRWMALDTQVQLEKFIEIVEMYRRVRDNLSLFTDWLNKADVAISIERTVNDSSRAKVLNVCLVMPNSITFRSSYIDYL